MRNKESICFELNDVKVQGVQRIHGMEIDEPHASVRFNHTSHCGEKAQDAECFERLSLSLIKEEKHILHCMSK